MRDERKIKIKVYRDEKIYQDRKERIERRGRKKNKTEGRVLKGKKIEINREEDNRLQYFSLGHSNNHKGRR